jgi:hypothetical protein
MKKGDKDFNGRSKKTHDDPRKRLEHFIRQRETPLKPAEDKLEEPAKPKEDLKSREEWFRKRHGGKGPK